MGDTGATLQHCREREEKKKKKEEKEKREKERRRKEREGRKEVNNWDFEQRHTKYALHPRIKNDI
jgi:hypothetical protein